MEGLWVAMMENQIGSIHIEDRLGAGGMGEVFLGWDSKLERQVAVKTIRLQDQGQEGFRLRYMREARLLSRLDPPGICRCFDLLSTADSDADGPFIEAQHHAFQHPAVRGLDADPVALVKLVISGVARAREMSLSRSTISRLRKSRSSSFSRLITSTAETRSAILTLPGFMTAPPDFDAREGAKTQNWRAC